MNKFVNMILVSIILFLSIMEAIHEGLALRGKNTGNAKLGTIAGIIEMAKLTGIVVMVVFLLWWTKYDFYFAPGNGWHLWRWFVLQLVIGWLAIRYSVFDLVHNLCAGVSIYYIGKMKLYDKFFTWLLRRQPKQPFYNWTRVILMALGISLILKL